MSDQLREALSAVIDGEADEFELRRVLDEVGRDEALASQWQRYEMIGAALRSEALAPQTLGTGLAAALDGDLDLDGAAPVEQAAVGGGLQLAGTDSSAGAPNASTGTDDPQRKGRFGPVLGMGVAAAVAFAVVVGVETSTVPDSAGPQIAEQLTVPSDGAAIPASDTTEMDTQRARAYLVHHVQQTAMSRGRVVSFARLASLEGENTADAPAPAVSSEN